MSDMFPLIRFYSGWEIYQQHLVKAITPLTPEQLKLQSAEHLYPVGVLAAHIISARVWWFHHVLREGPTDIGPLVSWDDDDAPSRTATELVQGLVQTWDLIYSSLTRWTVSDLDQAFERPGGADRMYTRQWVIWHVIEHDLHHGGELSFALGMHGVPAIDL